MRRTYFFGAASARTGKPCGIRRPTAGACAVLPSSTARHPPHRQSAGQRDVAPECVALPPIHASASLHPEWIALQIAQSYSHSEVIHAETTPISFSRWMRASASSAWSMTCADHPATSRRARPAFATRAHLLEVDMRAPRGDHDAHAHVAVGIPARHIAARGLETQRPLCGRPRPSARLRKEIGRSILARWSIARAPPR